MVRAATGTDEIADALNTLPFEEQQQVFQHLPVNLAGSVITHFPYYHQYVLLHSRPKEEMQAVVDLMNPDDRMRFLDELPEEAWRRFMDELSGAAPTTKIPAQASTAPRIERRHEVTRVCILLAPQQSQGGAPRLRVLLCLSPRNSADYCAAFGRATCVRRARRPK
jgi:hypothetical protein